MKLYTCGFKMRPKKPGLYGEPNIIIIIYIFFFKSSFLHLQ